MRKKTQNGVGEKIRIVFSNNHFWGSTTKRGRHRKAGVTLEIQVLQHEYNEDGQEEMVTGNVKIRIAWCNYLER